MFRRIWKEQLPPGHRLVSLGHVDLLFVFYYGSVVERVPVPIKADDPAMEEGVCFCFNSCNGERPALPFAWEELAVISMERNRMSTPERVVVVGRRLPGTTAHAPKTVAPAPVSGDSE